MPNSIAAKTTVSATWKLVNDDPRFAHITFYDVDPDLGPAPALQARAVRYARTYGYEPVIDGWTWDEEDNFKLLLESA